MHKRKILIIGEVYVDQHLDIIENGYSTSRLGGIFHAARSCDALNMEYALAYYAPNYLVKDIEKNQMNRPGKQATHSETSSENPERKWKPKNKTATQQCKICQIPPESIIIPNPDS